MKSNYHVDGATKCNLACRLGQSCWLLSPTRQLTEAAVTSAFADVPDGTTSGCRVEEVALGPVIGDCPLASAQLLTDTIVCPVLLPADRLAALLHCQQPQQLSLPASLTPHQPRVSSLTRRLLLLESSGGAVWGAATMLGPRTAATCAHLVASEPAGTTVRLRPVGGSGWRRARVLWANQAPAPPVFDAAFLELETGEPDLIEQLGPPHPGPPIAGLTGVHVTAAGFPYQTVSRPCPMLSHGQVVHEFGGLLPDNTSLTVAYQTSCPVFKGFSGGPIVLSGSGQVLAMNVGHLKLNSPEKNWHEISLSIPISLLQAAADRYHATGDAAAAFATLNVPPGVHRGWIWHAANGLLLDHNRDISRSKL